MLSFKCISSSQNETSKVPLFIGIHKEGQINFEEFLNGRNPLTLTDFSGKLAYRDIIEQILLLQALHRGGYQGNIKLVDVDFYKRRFLLIEQGVIHLSATPFWLSDLKGADDIYISPALIKEGQFNAGLYVHAEKTNLLVNQTLAQVQKLHAVSNRNWPVDWQVLTDLNLAGVNHSGQFILMTKMLVKGRADFMLAPFYNTPDLSFTQDDEKFIPIPNIKVILPGSRHFALSHNHPDFEEIKQALAKGFNILANEGIIEKAYTQSGFFNHQVKNWQIINE